jgi:hypothetical protein
VFVWSVWLVMMLVALACIAKYGRNIPLAEDWLLVAPLTGNEPDLTSWLWAQNNEHRVPLPRLILLALLKITNGDFRAGMFFNVITLGVIAFATIQVARHLRGGRTSFVDLRSCTKRLKVGERGVKQIQSKNDGNHPCPRPRVSLHPAQPDADRLAAR